MEYYKPQLLSSGGVSFCRLANYRSLTHSVFLACWVSTRLVFFFFPVHLWEEKRTSLLRAWWCNLIWVGAMWSQNSLSGEEVKLLLHHWVQVICHSHLALWSLLGKGCSSWIVLSPSVILRASAKKSNLTSNLVSLIFTFKCLVFKASEKYLFVLFVEIGSSLRRRLTHLKCLKCIIVTVNVVVSLDFSHNILTDSSYIHIYNIFYAFLRWL